MTLETKTIKAKDLGEYNQVFIYIPQGRMFFFADSIDVEEDKVTAIFEKGVSEGDLITFSTTFDPEKEVKIVKYYHIDMEGGLEDGHATLPLEDK